jgi:hypothetical protein
MKIAYIDRNFSDDRMTTIETANDIIEDYANQGYILTLRQLYYQFVARGLIENSERSYKNLGGLVADGRMAGYIDWDGIEDRGRGVKPWLIEESEQEVLKDIERGFALDKLGPAEHLRRGVGREGSAGVGRRASMRPVRVPYMSCKGYLSVSEAWRAGQRFEEMLDQGRHCVLIHLGDHDPSGIDMTRDNDDRLALFAASASMSAHRAQHGSGPALQPAAEPGEDHRQPRGRLHRKHGTTSWELDALQPQVLDKLISDEIETLIDPDVWDETLEEQSQRREVLAKFYSHFDQCREFAERFDEPRIAPTLMLPARLLPGDGVHRGLASARSARAHRQQAARR